jgi:hypothetical protein
MFRFTIRDLLWLTLVAAMALGWLLRDIHLRAAVVQANNETAKWRMRAGMFKLALKELGYEVESTGSNQD